MMIVDAHLDLAYNVTRGRDPRRPALEQPPAGDEIATVGLPDLRAGNVGLICATIFCAPGGYGGTAGYTNADEARVQALSQLAWYQQRQQEGLLRFVKNASDMPDGTTSGTTGVPLPMLLLLEGADALRTVDDLPEWFDAGLRIVGLAWKNTRYAGGTGAPGPLTDDGKQLVRALDSIDIIHDTSHLAEESFWDLMELSSKPVIASHSNCRAIVGAGDRHLTNAMIVAIAERGGVIGMNFYDKFLLPQAEHGQRRATLADVVKHIQHICDLTGSARHVALGTDMDGGLGREQIPQEIITSADLPKIGDALRAASFDEIAVAEILGENWLRFFREAL